MVPSFFKREDDSIYNKIAAAELTSIFHCVTHQQSYTSLDCVMKLTPKLYSDSAIAKHISCGRTKAEALVTSMLAPLASEFTQCLQSEDLYFSIATDASDKGNVKSFSLCVRFCTQWLLFNDLFTLRRDRNSSSKKRLILQFCNNYDDKSWRYM